MMLLLLVAAVSCEYNLDTILPKDDTGYIFMRALAMSGDTTVIWLDPTIPVGRTEIPDLEGVQLRLTADGREVALEREDGGSRYIMDGAWFAAEGFEPGSRLEITASHPDFPVAKSSTVVPDVFPECSVKAERVPFDAEDYVACSDMSGGNVYSHSQALHVTLAFKDNPSTLDYYGLRIVRSNGYFLSSQFYMDRNMADFSVNMANHIMILSPSDVFGPSAAYRFSPIVAFSDEDFNGQDVTKEYFVPYFEDDHKYHYTYHVELMKLSEGFWRNMEADFNYSWNNLSYYGQATIYPYTNIIGGLGAFGAVSPVSVIPLEIH